ncbi:hypothetical protein Ab1vBOLIVR5_gp106c [Agrobacterium phage OLIVR5]|uniref:Uncharacterized protein n=1 Tax=Agrobacterium phage OLIVR5 TaxID=2723773 RepID=A0A858MSK9_9CAUD|nr:hypothetical protein KNU99_gp106 [Agrobacterium phage OLIVR5]QIW87754.1 hypothetical protein Ab1vBOLIVR5_gp106c [Agrobacterium phage OLIVR5]QIW88016.1 hypothetical protein Ab1vBOLIVR6_gp109c [Agrobacterium phage OLIVR6]
MFRFIKLIVGVMIFEWFINKIFGAAEKKIDQKREAEIRRRSARPERIRREKPVQKEFDSSDKLAAARAFRERKRS